MDIEFDGVRVERAGRRVLDIPSLRLRSGQTTAILGPNGSGKTTLLRVIAGLERPSVGGVRFGDRTRPSVAYVFQEEVFLRRSVRDNLELGLRLRGLDEAEIRARVAEAATFLGIAPLMDRRADHLSGGEGRRVNLARALCLRSPLVLLDEPLEGLDERTYSRLLDELPRLLAAFDATTLLVTHNRHDALRLAQDLVVLVDGRVHASGDKRDVATDPRVAEVAEVLGYSVLTVDARRIAVPPGALKLGPGRLEFSMVVEDVFDLVDRQEIVGSVGDVRVHIVLHARDGAPERAQTALIHAEQFFELR